MHQALAPPRQAPLLRLRLRLQAPPIPFALVVLVSLVSLLLSFSKSVVCELSATTSFYLLQVFKISDSRCIKGLHVSRCVSVVVQLRGKRRQRVLCSKASIVPVHSEPIARRLHVVHERVSHTHLALLKSMLWTVRGRVGVVVDGTDRLKR